MATRLAPHAPHPAVSAMRVLLLCGWVAAASAAPGASPLSGEPSFPSGAYEPWINGQSRWSLGLVTEPRSVPPWAYGQDPRMVASTSLMVGMNLGPSSNARLVWYAPLTQPRVNTLAADALQSGSAVDANGVPLPTPLRVGLVLTPSDPWADLRQGSLTKLELSGHMALSLRSRGGGVWLALSGRW